jgi:rhamnose transport system permease protein
MQRDVFWAFTFCGAMAGLGGFLFLAKFGNITVVAGQGLELAVIAAVVVGGVNIFGGSGSMIGAFLGVILVEVLQQSLVRWIGISDFVRDFLLGLLILAAVASDKIILGRMQDAWVRVRRRDEAAAREAREQELTVGR